MCVKPLSAFIAICCELAGCYEEGSFSLSKGYIYVSIVQNISITISLYYLARKLDFRFLPQWGDLWTRLPMFGFCSGWPNFENNIFCETLLR